MAPNKKQLPKKVVAKKSLKKATAKKVVAKPAAKKTAAKPVVKKVNKSVSKTAKKSSGKPAVKKPAVKKPAVKKIVKTPVAKKSATSKTTVKKSVEKTAKKTVKKITSASPKNNSVESKNSAKKTVAAKKIAVDLTSKKNIAVKNDKLKKDKKNVEKDLAKSKKISKIDTLLADHNNNKTMQKKLTDTSQENKQDKKTNQGSAVNKIVSTVEKKSESETKPTTFLNSVSADNVIVEIGDPGFLKNDDVFDEADHAQWQQLREQADIQSRAMQLNKPERHPDFNGLECVECGIEIPLVRLKMHKVRCVDCQNELEQERARNQRSTYTSKSSNSSGWDD